MVAESQPHALALVDPLPAGLEIVNPALAASPTPCRRRSRPPEATTRAVTWRWCWTWFDHQNLRDDRAEAFSRTSPAGTYEYTYVARATTPGTFVVPPARAEEIYAPEVFGRTATDTVVVAG